MRTRVSSGLWCVLILAACGGRTTSEPAAAAPGAPASPGPTGAPNAAGKVRIGYQKIGSPFLLKARGETLAQRLREQGATLEWLEFQTGPLLLEAMRADAVDIGYVGETPPVFAQAGNVPFVYVAKDPAAPQAEALLVAKDSPIQKLEDLRGKRIALNRGSNVHYLLLQALEKGGLGLADVKVTFLAPADARVAFDSGQVDAWVIWDPFFAAAELNGARVLQDGVGLVDNHQFYVARSEFASSQPALLKTVLASFEELSAWAVAHPEEAARISAVASGIAYEALLRAEKRHAYGLGAITPEILAKQQKIADAFYKVEVLPRPIETKQAYLATANFAHP
jgi:sulfonate transport system substrate-binding protein